MSATNRSQVRKQDDFYETPEWCIRAILPHLQLFEGMPVLEPSIGNGAIARHFPKKLVTGIELDPYRAAYASHHAATVHTGNAISVLNAWREMGVLWDGLIIANPPFKLAHAFTEACLSILGEGAYCALLPLSYLGSIERAPFFQSRPVHIHIIPRRPSFTENNKTDAMVYGWFLWRNSKDGQSTFTHLELED